MLSFTCFCCCFIIVHGRCFINGVLSVQTVLILLCLQRKTGILNSGKFMSAAGYTLHDTHNEDLGISSRKSVSECV